MMMKLIPYGAGLLSLFSVIVVSFVGRADPVVDTGLDTGSLPVDTGGDPPESLTGRIYSSTSTYSLASATQYSVGDQLQRGPITWEFVGPALYSSDPTHGGIQTTANVVPAASRPSTTSYLEDLIMVDSDGHRFEAVSVSPNLVSSAVAAYNNSHPSDADPNAGVGVYAPEPDLPAAANWVYLSYDLWSHNFAQYMNGDLMLTGRFTGSGGSSPKPASSWFSKITEVGDIAEYETDAIVVTDYCSGVLIAPDIVLTARHCVFSRDRISDQEVVIDEENWCTRGNLSGIGAECADSVAAISSGNGVWDNGMWAPWNDWALVQLSTELKSTGEESATTMVLSVWDDQEDPRFEPSLLGAPILAGPMNQCEADGGDAFYNSHCDNLRYSREHATTTNGRALYLRKEGDVFVNRQRAQMVEYDAMFGSADSGGPVFWDGLVPGGERFVVSVVSMAFWEPGNSTFMHMRGPRIADWRSEIISACEAFGP